MSKNRLASHGVAFLAIAFFAFMAISSASTPGEPIVWDDSYPEEKLATVRFSDMKIDGFNGITVDKFYWVKIPAGEATFSGDVTIYHAGVNFHAKGMEFTCTFKEGKDYRVVGRANDLRWGVNVYEEGELMGFVPFKEQPVFTD